MKSILIVSYEKRYLSWSLRSVSGRRSREMRKEWFHCIPPVVFKEVLFIYFFLLVLLFMTSWKKISRGLLQLTEFNIMEILDFKQTEFVFSFLIFSILYIILHLKHYSIFSFTYFTKCFIHNTPLWDHHFIGDNILLACWIDFA